MSSREAAQLPQAVQHRAARPPLSNLVGFLWYWRGHSVQRSRERVLPLPTTELVIDLASGRTAGMAGPRSESFIIERSAQDELIGIHFRPGGIAPFLRMPATELHGQNPTLADVWGERGARELLDRLHGAATVELKFELLEGWLLRIAERPPQQHPAVAFALAELRRGAGTLSSAELADATGFSQRHFTRLFRAEVGLTPKLFSRVLRFHEVIRSLQGAETVDWSEVALACGYFDQAHFNHEFRECSGLTPTEYFALRTEHVNHVQVR